jgi:hypothetical protein
VVYTVDYIAANTKIAGVSAHLFILPGPLTRFSVEQDKAPLNTLKTKGDVFTRHSSMAAVARNRWVLIDFTDMTRGDEVFNLLREQGCDIIGMGHLGDGPIDLDLMSAALKTEAMMTVICRRPPVSRKSSCCPNPLR